MPRSKASRGKGKGVRGSRPIEPSFIPLDRTPTDHGFTLQSEALNTQRQQLSRGSDQKLRHSKVNFVSAGAFGPSTLLEPVVQLAEMSLQDDTEKTLIQHDSKSHELPTPELEDQPQEEQALSNQMIVDTRGTQSVTTDLPHPKIPPSSPCPSDSSEEVIVFAGRDQAGKGISRSLPAERRDFQHNSQINSIDDNIEARKISLTSNVREDIKRPGEFPEEAEKSQSMLSNFGNKSSLLIPHPVEMDSSNKVNSPVTNTFSALSRSYKRKDREQASFDDYIANMEAEGIGQLQTYNQRDLGGIDDGVWQETDFSRSGFKKRSDGEAWGHDELHDFDDMSTSDGMFESVQAILSKRIRKSGLQYLIIRKSQGIFEAQWTLRSNLTDPVAVKLIEEFEAEGKLVAEILYDDKAKASNSNYDSDGDDDLSLDEDDDCQFKDLDLEQHRIDRTDEEIARLLSKQEELGMGSAEMMLFNKPRVDEDRDEDVVLRVIPKRSQAERRSVRASERPTGDFMAASSLADVYDGFDVMDRERLSLKTKPKKRKGKMALDLSNSEVDSLMLAAVDSDRMRKRKKKVEREQLRSLGLLTQNNRPDLKAKYKEGMGINAVKDEIREFLKGDNTTLALPPMDKADRKVVHELANAFNLKSKSVGHGNKRFPVLYQTARTVAYNENMYDAIEARLTRRFLPRLDVNGKSLGARVKGTSRGGVAYTAATYRDGDIVGGTAPELGMENKGRAMLEKMGWSTGTALGALNNKGILQPVSHVVKTNKAGLG